MTFQYSTDSSKFHFYILDTAKERLPCAGWTQLGSEFLSQIAVLSELSDNGLADFMEEFCAVDSLTILELPEVDKLILGLPRPYPFDVFIEPVGVLTHSSFKLNYDFYDFCPNGTKLNAKRNGTLILINNDEYLLSRSQYLACDKIDTFNRLSELEKGNVTNLKVLSELKSLSKDGLVLEHFLNSQELFIPEKIKLDIDFNNGVLEIFPTVDIENPLGFNNTFDRLPNVRDVYPISGHDGRTTRVVFSEGQKIQLQKIKNHKKVSDYDTIQQILEHPELHYDEEIVDFEVFYSDRVKEIGVYCPKFYPFASPYKSQWIPGMIIRDRIIGEKRIFFRTPEKLYEFIEEKEEAIKEGKKTIQWENAEIPIDEAEKFIQTAKSQFDNPTNPVTKEKKTDNEVLIIKENAELTEFTNEHQLPESLKHHFFQLTNVANGIQLKEHQKEGISWLQSLFNANLSGGLLADDMGLGKTLQLLYFIEWHTQQFNDSKPYLIVAPVSLLENWENEYQKFFAPQNLPLYKLYGSVSLTKENDPLKNRTDAKRLQFKQIILTNYETVRSYQISLGLVDFAVVALDEAQKIKTPGTLVTNASKALKADFKIAMTGTPVENTLVDIWCIMDFAVPGLLGNAKDFARDFQKPLADNTTDIKKLTERLRDSIGIFIKRRLKRDVAKDLPTKHENEKSRIKKVMPPIQLERYKLEIEQANGLESEGADRRNQKLKSLWAIRDISDHPYLIESQILNFSTEELISASAKLQTTIGILTDIQSKNEKVIVFADRKETQKMLQKVIYDTFAVLPSIINGDTPTTAILENKARVSRQQTIDRFQKEIGFNVIIMSPIAAGVGLNVTKANHVIHYTRHWNPAKEEQATDRAYRIGQEKDVFVYYPMAVFPEDMRDDAGNKLKSFDEILDVLLGAKKNLATSTLFPTEQAEIAPDELFGNVFGAKTEAIPKTLSLTDIDRLHPNLFEASIAALFKKQGFDVYLTPCSNDKGVDVVAMKKGENYLLQAKQAKSIVGNDAIQEIYTARKYYEEKFSETFQLIAVTNNNFSSSAEMLAKTNGVKLIRRGQLEDIVNENRIVITEVNSIEAQRLARI